MNPVDEARSRYISLIKKLKQDTGCNGSLKDIRNELNRRVKDARAEERSLRQAIERFRRNEIDTREKQLESKKGWLRKTNEGLINDMSGEISHVKTLLARLAEKSEKFKIESMAEAISNSNEIKSGGNADQHQSLYHQHAQNGECPIAAKILRIPACCARIEYFIFFHLAELPRLQFRIENRDTAYAIVVRGLQEEYYIVDISVDEIETVKEYLKNTGVHETKIRVV